MLASKKLAIFVWILGSGPRFVLAQAANPVSQHTGAPGRYVGSQACQTCHPQIYSRWRQTRMANVVRDPKQYPDAILPDLSKPDPLVTFNKDDVAFVYGSKWKQRYFKKVGDDYFVLPAQWDITNQVWRPYFVKNGTDWWAPLYPPDNMKRPTGPLCDGCHSVNYNIENKTATEWNVGCEKCHGPGSDHVAHPSRANIVNPARLDSVQANDTCIQCHLQGQALQNPIAGRYYDWPVGFHVGEKLQDHWKLEEHKLGETTFTHFAGDGTLRMFDGTSYQPMSTTKLGGDADNIRWDQEEHRVYVGYGSGALAAVDEEGAKLGEIPLDGHPESFRLEPHGIGIFVNLPESRKIAVVDKKTKAVITTWTTDDALQNFPMALVRRPSDRVRDNSAMRI